MPINQQVASLTIVVGFKQYHNLNKTKQYAK